MSLNVGSGDLWSATIRRTVRERCKFMFNNELLSDVKFVVRDAEGEKKIPAHKFLLAISSPVFYAMFYGEMAEKKDSVDISECDHKSLLELFRFVYSDEVNLNANNVMQVLYLAKKYMLPSLADKCTKFLGENLDASNVFHVLPDAQKYEEKDLEDHCWEVIDKQANEAVKSDGFVTVEKSVLEALVERDSLNVKEVELFKALDCWATKECEKQGLAAKGSVKRRILGERIVKAIRFPVMKEKEFADVVLETEVLTARESFDMMKYFNSVLKVPQGFSESARAGCLVRKVPERLSASSRTGSRHDQQMTSVGSRNTDARASCLVRKVPEGLSEFSRSGSRQQMTSVGSRNTDARAGCQVKKVIERSSEFSRPGSRQGMTSVGSRSTDARADCQVRKIQVPEGLSKHPFDGFTSDGSRSTDGVFYGCPNCAHFGFQKPGTRCRFCGSQLSFVKSHRR